MEQCSARNAVPADFLLGPPSCTSLVIGATRERHPRDLRRSVALELGRRALTRNFHLGAEAPWRETWRTQYLSWPRTWPSGEAGLAHDPPPDSPFPQRPRLRPNLGVATDLTVRVSGAQIGLLRSTLRTFTPLTVYLRVPRKLLRVSSEFLD